MIGFRSFALLLLGLPLIGQIEVAHGQSLRFVGAANNIPFPPSCSAGSMQITLPSGTAPLNVSVSCNGVSFSCVPATLPATGGAVSVVKLRDGDTNVSTVTLTCAQAATITNLQTAITRFYQAIGDFNAGTHVPGPTCFLGGDRVVASNPSPLFTADREYRYTCVNHPGGGNPQPVSCYVVDRWSMGTPQNQPRYLRWNAQGNAVLVDDCINSAGGPQHSPYLFEDDFEEETTREPQTINFPQPPAQTYSPGGTFSVSATASSGLAVTFTSNTPARCTVSGTTVTIVSAGTDSNACSITASQNGNAQWQPATPVTRAIDINRAPQTITFDPPASVPFSQQSFSWPAPTGGPSGNPVIVTSLTPTICEIATSPSHTANILAAGKCDLVANQAGNANYLPGAANRTVNIVPSN